MQSTQVAFHWALSARRAAKSSRLRAIYNLIHDLLRPMLRKGGRIEAEVYGQRLLMPARHDIAFILQDHPLYNRGLGLAARVLTPKRRPLAVVDIGANIGETVAVIEQQVPNACEYLCVEADNELAELCRVNHKDRPVQVIQAFIGEDEGRPVSLVGDGSANAATTEDVSALDRLVRLDTVAAPFAEAHGLDLLKVDTEGFDFSVLRSGEGLLRRYKPALFFEWFPKLLAAQGEDAQTGFEYLASLGYRHFVFFVAGGAYYAAFVSPDRTLLESLRRVAESNPAVLYFDVFASNDKDICDALLQQV